MDLSINWFNPERTGRGSAAGKEIAIKKVKTGKPGNRSYAVSVIIPEEAMKKARMVVGDRAVVGFGFDANGNKVVAIKRVVNCGYKLGPATGKTARNGCDGKSVRARLQFNLKEGMFDSFNSEQFHVQEDGTLISVEADGHE